MILMLKKLRTNFQKIRISIFNKHKTKIGLKELIMINCIIID